MDEKKTGHISGWTKKRGHFRMDEKFRVKFAINARYPANFGESSPLSAFTQILFQNSRNPGLGQALEIERTALEPETKALGAR